MREHSWESHQCSHSWQSEFDRSWSQDSDDDGMTDQQRAAFEFMELLLQLYFSGVLTATNVCMLCYFAAKGGLANEPAAQYGLPPGRASGKYKDHLDERLEFKTKRRHMYHFEVPGRQRHSDDRVPVTIVARFDAS